MTCFRLALQSTGVIYGDIGTSPLYVYSSTFSSNPSYDDLVGALSIIIWTLTLIVTVKYVCIVLRADDDGEGGTFAVYSLLSRYVSQHFVLSSIAVLGTFNLDSIRMLITYLVFIIGANWGTRSKYCSRYQTRAISQY